MALLRVDGERLLSDLDALARISAGPAGVTRLGYTAAETAAHDWAAARLAEIGLAVRRDAAGNLIARLPGLDDRLPALACGSHLDTVTEGGRYDGALGVVAAIACAGAVAAGPGHLRHPLEVLIFRCEEAVYGGGTLGSRAMAGLWEPEQMHAPAAAAGHLTIGSLLRAAGFDPETAPRAARRRGELAGFLELHIEQGAVLEQAGETVGGVGGLVAIRRYQAHFLGEANHAGTTPMGMRKDALVPAARLVLAVEGAATRAGRGAVGTVGVLQVQPGAGNVIPGRVDLGFELRCLDEEVLDELERTLLPEAQRLGALVERVTAKEHVDSDPALLAAVGRTASALGQRWRTMPSGAGHDAMCMANICPVAMLFVPSKGGISHNPAEHTAPEHCVLGANALLGSLLELDARP